MPNCSKGDAVLNFIFEIYCHPESLSYILYTYDTKSDAHTDTEKLTTNVNTNFEFQYC